MAYQFMLKKKGAADAFIYLRYSYKETECLIATGKKIAVKHWDENTDKPKNSYPGGKVTLERLLTTILGQVQKAATELENEGEEPTADEVKKRYNENKSGVVRGATKAVTLWEQFIKEGEGKKDPKTIENETDSLETFKAFCKEKKKESLTMRKITKEVITAYELYLAPMAANTKAKKLKHFKAFLRSQKHASTELVKFKEVPGDKIFLTEEELTAFELHTLPDHPHLRPVRDLLVLQCATGLRVSDLKRIGPEHIQGNDVLVRARKNDEFIRIPLSKRVADILARYNYRLPTIADQTYNEQIKDLAEVVIPESKVEVTEYRNGKKTITTCFKYSVLTSHCNVRTFITLAAGRGMPVPSIAAITGKSVLTLLRSYLNPNQEQAYKHYLEYDRPTMTVNTGTGA
ncbi:MAG TPA: phage integrase SAM-like domain-containing protein [Chryseosolibacter sp.]|nr:phage integrase SAM-like domain-containing protein [Chryseosolibacter sp.]